MFLILAFTAMVGYGLQITLMASVYRHIDPFKASAARGLALGLIMLPLLLLVNLPQASEIAPAIGPLAASALFAALGNGLAGYAVQYLQIGIACAATTSLVVIAVTVIDLTVFKESLSATQYGMLLLIIASIARLGLLQRTDPNINEHGHRLTGFWYAAGAGTAFAVASGFLAHVSRFIDPVLTGYCWEFSIGLVSILIFYVRRYFIPSIPRNLTLKEFAQILLRSSPTAIATAAFAVSLTLGPLTIATAVVNTSAIAATLFAFFFYRERISRQQLILMALIVASIIAMQVV